MMCAMSRNSESWVQVLGLVASDSWFGGVRCDVVRDSRSSCSNCKTTATQLQGAVVYIVYIIDNTLAYKRLRITQEGYLGISVLVISKYMDGWMDGGMP
jgi:hypothetical protein